MQPHLQAVPLVDAPASPPPTPPAPPTSSPPSDRQQRPRADKPLPSDRIKPEVQRKLLRAGATISGPAKRIFDASDLARSTGLAAGTAALCNNFFVDSGWFERAGKGKYTASDQLLDYARSIGVKPDDVFAATGPLRETATKTWYWQVLEPMLRVGKVAQKDALVVLMREAGATPHKDHLQQLGNLLDWLSHIGLIRVSEDQVQLRAEATDSDPAPQPLEQEDEPVADMTGGGRSSGEATARGQGSAGSPVVLGLHFSLRLTADDLAKLSAEQITALYQAVGTVAAITRGSE